MQIGFSSGPKMGASKTVLYGVEGIGKSTFAACFPGAVFIDLEESTKFLDVQRFEPAPRTWPELIQCVEYMATVSPGYTVVVDTLDAAEKLCADHVCAINNWKSIEQPGYGKGYVAVKERFAELLAALSRATAAGVHVCCTAHAAIRKFEQPDEVGAYDRWELKLSKHVAPLVKEWADALLFANYRTDVTFVDGKAKASGKERVMYCNHAATWDAKNRWGLPDEVPFSFESIRPHVAEVKKVTPHEQLAELMVNDGIMEAEVVAAFTAKHPEYEGTQIADWPAEAVGRLVKAWDKFKVACANTDAFAESVPFN